MYKGYKVEGENPPRFCCVIWGRSVGTSSATEGEEGKQDSADNLEKEEPLWTA
jgi:hypothetical protein